MADSLMMAFPVVVVDVLVQHEAQRALADEPQPVEAFVLERFDEAFAMRIGAG